MLFLVQQVRKDDPMYIDQEILKDLIRNSHHKYEEVWLTEFYFEGELLTKSCFPEAYQKAIPLGTIEFVNTCLKTFHGVEMKPIEVPEILRTQEFLKRDYSIKSYAELPNSGKWFIKDASILKGLKHVGNRENMASLGDELNEEHVYQVSEMINIKSEYRIYFVNGKLYTLANYDGDPTLFPDIGLINKANYLYSQTKDYPGSYTMDVAITDKGTCIVECHVLFSCGLYTTVLGTNFLNGYIETMKFVLNNQQKN